MGYWWLECISPKLLRLMRRFSLGHHIILSLQKGHGINNTCFVSCNCGCGLFWAISLLFWQLLHCWEVLALSLKTTVWNTLSSTSSITTSAEILESFSLYSVDTAWPNADQLPRDGYEWFFLLVLFLCRCYHTRILHCIKDWFLSLLFFLFLACHPISLSSISYRCDWVLGEVVRRESLSIRHQLKCMLQCRQEPFCLCPRAHSSL